MVLLLFVLGCCPPDLDLHFALGDLLQARDLLPWHDLLSSFCFFLTSPALSFAFLTCIGEQD